MITSWPSFQFTGVATLCFAVSCIESITRSTSSKLRPVLIGYDKTSFIFLVGPDHIHVANRGVIRGRAPFAGFTRRSRQHPVELRDLEIRVANHRIVRRRTLGLGDVLRPALMTIDRIDTQA